MDEETIDSLPEDDFTESEGEPPEEAEAEGLEESEEGAVVPEIAEGVSAEEAEEEEAPARITAPVSRATTDEDYLRETLDTDVFERLMRVVDGKVAHATQSATYANVQIAQAAQAMPNLMKVIGPRVQQNIAALDPSLKTSDNAVSVGIITAMMQEINSPADIPAVLARYSKMAGNAPAGKKAQAAPPPSQRPPTGGSVATTRATASPPATRAEREIKSLMADGLTRSEAIAMLREEGIR